MLNRNKAVFIFVFVTAIAVTGGCASVPMAGANEDTQAKSFVATTDGRANLYVYRNETFGAAIKRSTTAGQHGNR